MDELIANDITDIVKNISVEVGINKKKARLDEVDLTQISLFDTVRDDDIINQLKDIDINNLRPVDALNILSDLQNKVKNRW